MATLTDSKQTELDRKIADIMQNNSLNVTVGTAVNIPLGPIFGQGRIRLNVANGIAFIIVDTPGTDDKPPQMQAVAMNSEQALEIGYMLMKAAESMPPSPPTKWSGTVHIEKST